MRVQNSNLSLMSFRPSGATLVCQGAFAITMQFACLLVVGPDLSALCQKRTLLASWNVSLPRAGQGLYAANPASNDLLHIAIFKFEV